ncbi:MAG: DUF177 domain-containing protein [Ignavibacteriaceae bacterium]|jgi:uncharacterized protein
MFIKISNLRDGEYVYQFNEPVEEIELENPFYNNFTAAVKLSKVNNQLVLDAELSAHANFECDRCAVRFDMPVNANYRMVYLFSNNSEEPDSLNITYLPMDSDKIFLDKDFRDYLMLAIPMKKLCKEDCKGLCYKCGKDLNEGDCDCQKNQIDARWLPLNELKNKLNIN